MVAGDSAATANVWLVLVDAAALAITAGGRRGVRMLLLLLTDMPSERTSGESAGFNVQHPGRRLHWRELQLGRRLLGIGGNGLFVAAAVSFGFQPQGCSSKCLLGWGVFRDSSDALLGVDDC